MLRCVAKHDFTADILVDDEVCYTELQSCMTSREGFTMPRATAKQDFTSNTFLHGERCCYVSFTLHMTFVEDFTMSRGTAKQDFMPTALLHRKRHLYA